MTASAPGTPGPILTVHLAHETDFLLARQRAKQIAKAAGFDVRDQTRIATAVSEIARNAFEYAGGGKVEYRLDRLQEQPCLRIVVSDQGRGIPQLEQIWSGGYRSRTGMGMGLIGARRLMDELAVQTGPAGTEVALSKRLPAGAGPMPSPGAIAAALTTGDMKPSSALREQNQELLTTLDELRARDKDLHLRETELQALNAELEETNRGVMVLYAELADKAQAVQQANEMKTRFLSGVTHELRTPLNSIVSLSRLMLAHTDGPINAEQEKQMSFILRSAQHLSEMVSDLLDLAKVEAGKTTTNLTTFPASDLLAGLRGMFRPLATNPRVKLSIETPDQPLLLRTDEGKVAQILRNFISNALKFTEAGTVRLTVQALEAPMVRFSVEDTGVGIRAEDHDLVMQEWGQAPGAEGKTRGSGLGLPLSRSLAELLGGSVDFRSTPGQGSTFNVTLPALVVDLNAAQDQPEAFEDSPYILIGDADEVARYLLRRSLGALTHTPIEEAVDASGLERQMEGRLPRLLFLDLMLPPQGGLELLRKLRGEARTRALPVLLYTARELTPEEQHLLHTLDATALSKRPAAAVGARQGEERQEQQAQIERALLQVGLNNIHMGTAE